MLQPGSQKWIYRVGVGLITALNVWLIIFIAMMIERQSGILFEIVLLGLFIGICRVLKEKIEPIETLGFSWKNISISWTSVLTPELKLFLFLGLISVQIISSLLILIQTGQLITSIFTLIIALVVCLCIIGGPATILGLIYLLGVGLRGSDIPEDKRKIANQGIWQTLYK